MSYSQVYKNTAADGIYLSNSVSVSREYSNVNQNMPKSYWDYDELEITWNAQDNYEIIRKVGRGKYSEVFEGFLTLFFILHSKELISSVAKSAL